MSSFLYLISSTVFVAFFLAASISGAETSEDFNRLQEEMERLRGQVKERTESVQEMARKEKTIFEEFEKTGKALAAAQSEERDINNKLRKVEAEISRLISSLDQSRGEVAANEGVVAARLKAMYKQGRTGYFSSIFASDTHAAALRHYHYLTIVAASDQALLSGFSKLASDAKAQYMELEKQKAELLALKDESERKRVEVAKRLKEKKEILAASKKERSYYEGMIKGMEESSLYLQSLLKRVSQSSQALSASSAPPSAITPAVSAPSVNSMNRKDAGEKPEAKSASLLDMKGKLPWPATGVVVGRFGRYQDPQSKVDGMRRGIEIAAPVDSEVVAVFPGKVIYANWLKGYGKAVILDHGATYYTVYAHISDIVVREGDRLDQGAVIGKVGDTGSLKGPDLYFEVRRGGEAEDPVLWLKRR